MTSDNTVDAELDFADGFIEGYLTGLMMGHNYETPEGGDSPQ